MMKDTLHNIGTFRKFINVARGRERADRVLRGGKVVNVFTREIIESDIAIFGDRIAGVGNYRGKRETDCHGLYLLPGLIDGHIHLESTHLTPLQFTRTVLAHGTTAVVIDPHEIANVAGFRGILWLLKATEDLPLDFYFMAPSCVPASTIERTGIKLTDSDIERLLEDPRVLGLAEVMDIAGVLEGKKDVIKKLIASRRHVMNGHAPLLSGADLNAYIATGIGSDHESTSYEEALEKLRLGMHVMIREGSLARDMASILKKKEPITSDRCFFVSDDILPQDLVEEGHMDRIVQRAIGLGIDRADAVRMATLNTARYFGLTHRGGIAPGYMADLVAVKDIDKINVQWVIKGGRIVFKNGRTYIPQKETPPPDYLRRSVNAIEITPDKLKIRAGTGRIRTIGLLPDSLLTQRVKFKPKVKDGYVSADPERDLLKILVHDRHRHSPDTGIGFVKGCGIRHGALASSVAHDSHNLIAVGVDDEDISLAINHLIRICGGMVVVDRGRVLKDLPLPLGGLLSDRKARWVVNRMRRMDAVCRDLGTNLPHPFITLSFLALPVIPDLKITERGLVDVKEGRIIGIFDREND